MKMLQTIKLSKGKSVKCYWLAVLVFLATISIASSDLIEIVPSDAMGMGYFADSIAALDDINGDNHGDILISQSGRVYLYDGSTQNVIHTFVSPNRETEGHFGYGVTGIPDVTGDGINDIAIVARGEDSDWGRIYIYNGTNYTLVRTIENPGKGGSGIAAPFSRKISGIPDITGDGLGDIAVHLLGGMPPFGSIGGVLVFNGATGDTVYSYSYEDIYSIYPSPCGISDINHDGRGDFLIGVPIGEFWTGCVYVYSGATGNLLRTLETPYANQGGVGDFGYAVSGIPDVTGDGINDIVVGDPSESEGIGRTYIFNGVTGDLLNTLSPPNPCLGEHFGNAVSGIPDLNGDGKGDVVVGSYGEFQSGGRVYIFDSATGDSLHMLESPHPDQEGELGFGSRLSGITDISGDGKCDVIIGAPREDVDTHSNAGRAYIFHSEMLKVWSWKYY